METMLVDFARKDGWRNRLYRAYLYVKRFVLGLLGFKTATWFSKDKRILSCDVVSDEVFYEFVTPLIWEQKRSQSKTKRDASSEE